MNEYTVTSIAQAKKNIERVNIFLDDAFWVGLDKDNLIKYGLFKGLKINDDLKQEIEKASVDGKLLEKVMNFIMLRPRSIKEVRDYLVLRRGLDKEEAEGMINMLQSKGYLSDKEFAKWYTENRLGSGFHGPNKIKAELIRKGVARNIVKQVLSARIGGEVEGGQGGGGEVEKIKAYIAKISGTIKAKDKYELKNKLIQRLMSRGYGYDQVKKVLNDTDLQ